MKLLNRRNQRLLRVIPSLKRYDEFTYPKKILHTVCFILSGILLLTTSGCNQEQPVSYKIPKEERKIEAPSEVENKSQTTLQLLPGMQEAAETSAQISYRVPESWEEIPPSGIRKANFKITENTGSAEITVLTFPGDVGGQLANINRWRSQIGLEAATSESIADYTKHLKIAGHQCLYVRLRGDAQSILGVVLPLDGDTWFFKMTGDTSIVFNNEAKMEQFLNSVEFEGHTHQANKSDE